MKERLTGALILVALLVVLVPEILPGPVSDRASRQDTPAAAADGPPLRSYSMELGAEGRAAESGQSALAPRPAAQARTPAAPQAAAPEPDPAPSAATAGPGPGPAAPVPPTATTAGAARPAPTPAPAVPADPGNWWVQVGSFSQSENAQRLSRDLAKAGFRMQVTPMRSGGRDLYRVRAGPVADRAAAEALRARLADAGHKGTLVAP